MAGGSSESDSSVRNDTQSTNNVQNHDLRAVASDAAVSVTGSGSSVDRSSTTTLNDLSDRSTVFTDMTNKSTNFADSSVRTDSHATNFSDSSVRDSSTRYSDSSVRNTTTSDYGSIAAAIGLSGQTTNKAFDTANLLTGSAISFLKDQADQSQKLVMRAFDASQTAAAATQKSTSDMLGFANQAIEKSSDAFANAKDGGQQKFMLAAIAALAVVAVAFAVRAR